MRTRRQKILEDRQAVVGRLNAGENSLTIPDDLISEIFSRLPAKSIARCRCLSKLWASVIDGQAFTDLYLKRSSARPQLLFAFQEDGKVFFFSSPHQPQNQEEVDNISHVAVNYHMSFPSTRDNDINILTAISGWVCARDKNKMAWVICNPSTGQSFTLPTIKTRIKTRDVYKVRYFSGYDPVDKKVKVLSIRWERGRDGAMYQEHQVLTLETGKLSWRMIECDVPHLPYSTSVCINGVLYYKADLHGSSSFHDTIMSFDVRYEKYNFTKVVEPFTGLLHPATTLINCNGKLASIRANDGFCFSRKTTSFEMWVLDDLEKKEWSKHVYELPPIWENVAADNVLYCAGVTCSNEVVLVKYFLDGPFYVFYFSLKTETSRTVEIQGMRAFRDHRVYTFVDHVEDVKLLKAGLGV